MLLAAGLVDFGASLAGAGPHPASPLISVLGWSVMKSNKITLLQSLTFDKSEGVSLQSKLSEHFWKDE